MYSDSLHTQKQNLRKEIRAEVKRHSQEELQLLSHEICCQLLSLDAIKRAEYILIYSSIPGEVETTEAINSFLRQQKKILLPVVTSKTEMEVRLYTGNENMQQGSFGILEPIGKAFTDFDKIDVAIVPGVAFDMQHHRLGRGKGYYDRFLPLLPQAKKIALCFPFQLIPAVPTDSFDIEVDRIVTPQGLF